MACIARGLVMEKDDVRLAKDSGLPRHPARQIVQAGVGQIAVLRLGSRLDIGVSRQMAEDARA